MRIGAAEGFDPHPLFCGDWYISRRPDLAVSGVNPLAHYLSHGWREGVSPHPLFDTDYYLAQAGRGGRGQPALLHYLTQGWREGFKPHPLFDPAWYLDRYPDVAAAGAEPLAHFVTAGGFECRDRSEEHTSELQSRRNLVCRLLLEKKKKKHSQTTDTTGRSPL